MNPPTHSTRYIFTDSDYICYSCQNLQSDIYCSGRAETLGTQATNRERA